MSKPLIVRFLDLELADSIRTFRNESLVELYRRAFQLYPSCTEFSQYDQNTPSFTPGTFFRPLSRIDGHRLSTSLSIITTTNAVQ